MNITVKLVDICYSDYLTDHHNRDGELLLGVPLAGQTAEEMANALVLELNSADWEFPWEHVKSDQVKLAALECLTRPNQSALSPIPEFEPDTCECCGNGEWCDCDQPSAWFLLEWEE